VLVKESFNGPHVFFGQTNTGHEHNNIFGNGILTTHVGRFQDLLAGCDPRFEKPCFKEWLSVFC